MNKQLLFNEEARHKIQKGINIVANAVKVTLGPKGRNVILDQEYGQPHITKDGVSVAKEIELKDKYQNVGVKLIKSVANKTVNDVGDATTTSTVLTQAIINEGLKNVTSGANPLDLKKGIDAAVNRVVEYIKECATPVDNKIAQVATISANNDEIIGNLIADAVNQIGTDGIITIEEAMGTETYIQVNEGIQFNTGFLSPYFITDRDKSTCVLENPYVLLYDSKITDLKIFYNVLETIMSQKKSILIIANDYDSEVLDTLVLNKIKANFKICAVKTPRLKKIELHEDISAVTGASIINDTFDTCLINHLGVAEKIIIDKHNTTIINGHGLNLKEHLEYLKEHNEEERYSKLKGGIATIYVGANSEVELKEKKDRVEDAVCATKAAIEEGIVPGGGSVYIKAVDQLNNLIYTNSDINTGVNIIRHALCYPIKQICSNAGISGNVIIDKIMNRERQPIKHLVYIGNDQEGTYIPNPEMQNYGYNVKTNEFGDLIEMGVIDPAKAVRVALENAASVAGLFLTTECVIVDDID
jgi:chaperonin GroEL